MLAAAGAAGGLLFQRHKMRPGINHYDCHAEIETKHLPTSHYFISREKVRACSCSRQQHIQAMQGKEEDRHCEKMTNIILEIELFSSLMMLLLLQNSVSFVEMVS